MNTLTPFKGLELIATIDDDKNIYHLLDPNREGLLLLCDVCSGKSFEIKVLIEAMLDVSISTRHKQAILRNHEVRTISAIKVIRCATCGSDDFIREEIRRDENEQENSSVGQSSS